MTLLTDLLFGVGANVPEGTPHTIQGLLFGKDSTVVPNISEEQIDALIAQYLADHPGTGITASQVDDLVVKYLTDNNFTPDEIKTALTTLQNTQTGLTAVGNQNATDVVENKNRLDALDNLTHELTVEYDFNWENDNDVQFAFTGTEPNRNNIANFPYRSRIVPSQILRLQYIVMRVPRNLDPGNTHKFRLHGVADDGTEKRILLARDFTAVHFTANYD